ncbi:1-(5-phosphoribosyl)-5-[(5-phosphoribosylamino)methylideneamino]imidazole-4-carboxamide isomerase [Legionella dresdenensis]|uniref:1-(5-phosphoribosyl)-5-[(5-phosphoribosylamino)methylideneamino] imidazole-4-carboxamide isomerase n=1 Tax=Legionella dresdenensis TaxID=450200 RepID=A0ABV8CBB7_9GAMM
MNIIPSIDLKNGQCVRLKQGDFKQLTIYPLDPVSVAQQYNQMDISCLHIVDLDGAEQKKPVQLELIAAIASAFKGDIQVGGGVRTRQDIEALFTCGVTRVVIGTSAVMDVNRVRQWLQSYSAERIVIALDFWLEKDMPFLAINGWQTATAVNLWQQLELFTGIEHVLCTDISKDGMGNGPNLEFYRQAASRFPAVKFQASGGVSSLKDIHELKDSGVAGCIIGKALFEGTLKLPEVAIC